MAVKINLGNSLFNKEQKINDLLEINKNLETKGLCLIEENGRLKSENNTWKCESTNLSNQKKILEINYEKMRLENERFKRENTSLNKQVSNFSKKSESDTDQLGNLQMEVEQKIEKS